jgi:hypothetical protein
MKLTDFLQNTGRPIAYYPSLRKITGSTTATILLCQFIYWRGKESDPDGWLYKESAEIEQETGLSYDEQKTARKKLVENGLLKEHYARLDHQMKFRLNLDEINKKWSEVEIPESRNATFGKAESPFSLNGNTETTTEHIDNSFESKGTAYNRGEQERPDKVAMYLQMANFKGAKIESRIDSILSYLGETLRRNTSTKEWRVFAKYVLSEKDTKGWDVEVFVKWLLSKPDYKPDYWSVKRMTEFYPQAFLDNPDEEKTRLL